MSVFDRLIFVCTGNTCRSPMAKVLFESMEPNSGVQIVSRGLVVLFSEPANPKAVMVAGNHNLSLKKHIAKQLCESDINEESLILTMTQEQKLRVIKHFPTAQYVYAMKEYVGEIGDVADPYGGSLMEYEECFGELARLVKKAAYKLTVE